MGVEKDPRNFNQSCTGPKNDQKGGEYFLSVGEFEDRAVKRCKAAACVYAASREAGKYRNIGKIARSAGLDKDDLVRSWNEVSRRLEPAAKPKREPWWRWF